MASFVPASDFDAALRYRRATTVPAVAAPQLVAADSQPILWSRKRRMAVIACSIVLSWVVVLAPFLYFM